MLEKGIKGSLEIKVTAENTALTMGSGTLEVFATPSMIALMVRCESELVEIDGRKLVFKVAAYDEAGLIGEGTHERFIIKNEKFQTKANSKKAK